MNKIGYNGYESKYHETVEVVCSTCHHEREAKKKEAKK